MIKTVKILFISFIIFAGISFPQSFTATVNNSTVGLNDQFQVSFTFEGKDVNGVKNFQPPAFTNFLVLSGPNQSTSMQIINGAVSGSLTFSYILQPRSMGNYSIGPASVDYDGKSYKSDALNITVVKGTPKTQAQNDNTISTKEIAENLFILATIDKKNVYPGEQVTVTYKLYTRLNIAAQMSISKLPQYQGFWSEEIETSANINFTTEMYKGKQFRVGILKKAALFPTQTGELTVTPFELNVPVQIMKKKKSNNFFDDFFNDPFDRGQTYNFDAKSNSVKVNVKSLPSGNVPKSFSGAVGEFNFSANIDKSEAKTNEPITLKLNVSGSGNIKLVNMPEINLPNGFEKYEPKTTENINRTGTISGSKTAEYVIIPRTPGKKEIPPIDFTYFDLKEKRYETFSSKAFNIDVKPGANYVEGNNASGVSKKGIKLIGQDIRYLKTSFDDIQKQSGIIIYQTGFWVAAGVPLFLLFGLVYWRKREDKLAGNIQLLRYQKAEKVAKNRLKSARKLMGSNNHNDFYAEISAALFGYLEDKFHIPKSEFSLDRAVLELEKKNAPVELAEELKRSVENCEYVRFAPRASESAAMHEIYDDTSKVIIEIEKLIASKK